MAAIEVDGNGLTIEDLVKIGYLKAPVKVTEEAWGAVMDKGSYG